MALFLRDQVQPPSPYGCVERCATLATAMSLSLSLSHRAGSSARTRPRASCFPQAHGHTPICMFYRYFGV